MSVGGVPEHTSLLSSVLRPELGHNPDVTARDSGTHGPTLVFMNSQQSLLHSLYERNVFNKIICFYIKRCHICTIFSCLHFSYMKIFSPHPTKFELGLCHHNCFFFENVELMHQMRRDYLFSQKLIIRLRIVHTENDHVGKGNRYILFLTMNSIRSVIHIFC